MEIRKFSGKIVDANSYLIVEGNKGLLIDAVASEDMFGEIQAIDELTVIITHCHFDHISAINDIRRLLKNVKVISSVKCSEKMGSPSKNMSSTANIFLDFYNNKNGNGTILDKLEPFSADEADEVFDEELSFEWGKHNILLKSVYGHSDDGIIIVLDEDCLFSGDSLLGIPTVTRFPSGSTRKFWEHDMPLFESLNDKMIVYPGHGDLGMIRELIKINVKPARYR